ncbi:MAG: sodium:calcium antiporter, partial [Bacteroidales bacterium]
MSYLYILAGFALLVAGADYLVKGASSLAKRLKLSELVIGLTIVSIGTSAPELSVNILASLKNSSQMAVGNIIGSNLFNLLVVLALSAL